MDKFDFNKVIGFVNTNDDEVIINNIIEFCVINDMPTETIKSIIYKTKNEVLKGLATLFVEDKINEMFVEKVLDANNLQFEIKREYGNNPLALQLIVNYLENNKQSINIYDLYKECNIIKYSFLNHFKQIMHESYHILSRGDITNELSKNRLENNYILLIQKEETFSKCKTALQIEFYRLFLSLSSELGKNAQFDNTYHKISENTKTQPTIQKCLYYHKLNNRIPFDKEEFYNYVCQSSEYSLLLTYFQFQPTSEEAILFFKDYKYILKSDIELFVFYSSIVRENLGEKEFLTLMIDYKRYHDSNIIYKLIEFENDISTDDFQGFVAMLEDTHFHVAYIPRIANLLYRNKRVEKAIQFLNKYRLLNINFEIQLAQMLIESENAEDIDRSQKIIENLMNEGYEDFRIYKLRAIIFYKKGYELGALKNFEGSYKLNNDNLNTIINILMLRYNNIRVVEDDFLRYSSTLEYKDIQRGVALHYLKLGKQDRFLIHATKSLLLCENFDEQIYGLYFVGTVGTHSERVDYEIVNENMAIFLECLETLEQVKVCIYKEKLMLPSICSNFANATHITNDHIVAIELFRKKVGDKVKLENKEYQIKKILTVDAFLWRYCYEQLLEYGNTIKALTIDENHIERSFDEILKMMPSDTNNIFELYTKPINNLPIPIHPIAKNNGKKYLEAFLYILYKNDTVFWNNPFTELISINDNVILTYNIIILLATLGIREIGLKEYTNISILESTLSLIQDEFRENYSYMNRESVMFLFNHDNSLHSHEYSEEEKADTVRFNLKVKLLSEACKPVKNSDDSQAFGEKGTKEIKELIGMSDYDSLAVKFNGEDKTIIVSEDFFISKMANDIKEINKTTCGIIDFLIFLKIPINEFMKHLLKLAEFGFICPITLNAIVYISNGIAKDGKIKNQVLEMLKSLLKLPEKEDYMSIVGENIKYILRVIYYYKIQVDTDIFQVIYVSFVEYFMYNKNMIFQINDNGELHLELSERLS